MRDLVLVIATLGFFLPVSFRFPAAGVLCWTWVSITSPQTQLFGFAAGQQFNLLIAVATLAGWLISSERKRLPPGALPKILIAFTIWATFNSFFAVYPDYSWPYWERVMRSWALVLLVLALMNNKARIHAQVLVIVLSLGFYGVKGGIFTILTGGNFRVWGPEATVLGDNNQLAAAVVMSLPLINYLRLHTRSRLMRMGFTAAIILEIFMVLGSQSRGGAIALAVTLGAFWLRTRNKIVYGLASGVLAVVALSMMPNSWYERMQTVNDLDNDGSFQGRLVAWGVAWNYAIQHFPFGAGFYAPQLPSIYHIYAPGATPHAAHSIYFQVLGEHGFMGLAIYLLVLVVAFRNTFVVLRQTRDEPEWLWAYDLAKMLQVAIAGFCVGGAALSMAYFDGFIILLALTSMLRELTAPAEAGLVLPTRLNQGQMSVRGVALPSRTGQAG